MGLAKQKLLVGGAVCLLAVSGCGANRQKQELLSVTMETYDRIEYQYMEVVREDLESSVNLFLECKNFEIKKYMPPYEDMVIESFLVGEGDRIKEGQLLARYQTKEYDKQLESYEEEYGKLLLTNCYLVAIIASIFSYFRAFKRL